MPLSVKEQRACATALLSALLAWTSLSLTGFPGFLTGYEATKICPGDDPFCEMTKWALDADWFYWTVTYIGFLCKNLNVLAIYILVFKSRELDEGEVKFVMAALSYISVVCFFVDLCCMGIWNITSGSLFWDERKDNSVKIYISEGLAILDFALDFWSFGTIIIESMVRPRMDDNSDKSMVNGRVKK